MREGTRTGCASLAESGVGAGAVPTGSAGGLLPTLAAPADNVTLRLTLPTSVDRTTDAKRSVWSVSDADLRRKVRALCDAQLCEAKARGTEQGLVCLSAAGHCSVGERLATTSALPWPLKHLQQSRRHWCV